MDGGYSDKDQAAYRKLGPMNKHLAQVKSLGTAYMISEIEHYLYSA